MKVFYGFLIPLSFFFSCNQQQKDNKLINVSAEAQVNGEQLFKANCYQCHRAIENFAAPALAGVEQKWEDKATLYAFIRNSQDVIKRNEYAAALYQKWNKLYMQPFPDLSDKEIEAILAYCNAQRSQ